MSRIDKLIEELCPEGVEFKEMGTVCSKIFAGGTPRTSNKEYYNGTIPWLRSGEINFNIIKNAEIFISEKGLKNSSARWISENSVLIAMTGATVARTGINEIPLTANQSVCALETNNETLNYKFLYYLLSKDYLKLKNLGQGVLTSMNLQIIKSIQIPVPPLPIQQEIVNILDKFTALDAELQAELEARKKQYEYYRNQLLNFEGKEVKWKILGEVCEKINNIKWKDNINKEFKYIDLTSVSRENNSISDTQVINSTNAPSRAQQIVFKEDVIFATTRPTLKRFSLITSHYHKQVCSTGFCVLRANQDIILPKFLFFIIKTSSFNKYVENYQEGASYPSISDNRVRQFRIPVPLLAEQERIVSILDKFEELVNSVLPAEIEARRKQYEYYREKLLTFNKVEQIA